MACGDKKAQFGTVILDPTLTATLPRLEAAITGIDAIAHAIESYVSTKRNPLSQMFSQQAWNLLNANYELALKENNLKHAVICFRGISCGARNRNSMLGAAHACANPLTSRYGITHGVAVA